MTLVAVGAVGPLVRLHPTATTWPAYSRVARHSFSSTGPRHLYPIVFKGHSIRNSRARPRAEWVLPGGERGGGANEQSGEDFVVVNFYRLVHLENPKAEVARHLAFLEGHDIHGRIYINEQGINAQYSGPKADALAYAEWLREDARFSDLLVQISPASCGHAFPRLKLRYKPSLVQFESDISELPIVDPAMRATPLPPSEWKSRLLAMNNSSKVQQDGLDHKLLLLDVRNGYEWDVGHFRGSERPAVDCFRNTSFGLSECESSHQDPLADVDKENTDILMYCTGGIRCDVYSTILRQKGFKNLYTLSGGVSNYLNAEGPVEWIGNLFVFDSRLSLPPGSYKEDVAPERADHIDISENPTFARCYICGSLVLEFRHRNCANLDCNFLFLSCNSCVAKLKGCCSSDCMSAPRLRPVLTGHQRYRKWHIYRDGVVQNSR